MSRRSVFATAACRYWGTGRIRTFTCVQYCPILAVANIRRDGTMPRAADKWWFAFFFFYGVSLWGVGHFDQQSDIQDPVYNVRSDIARFQVEESKRIVRSQKLFHWIPVLHISVYVVCRLAINSNYDNRLTVFDILIVIVKCGCLGFAWHVQ